MDKRSLLAVVAVPVAVVVLGACGSSSGPSSTSAGGVATSTPAGATSTPANAAAGSPVTLMSIATVGSPIEDNPGGPAGAAAAAKAINAAGGINGHKVNVVFCNPEADPNKAVACARQAATDKAIAVVGMTDTLDNVILPVLQQEGIPDVGATVGGNPIDVQSPDAYPLTPEPPAPTWRLTTH